MPFLLEPPRKVHGLKPGCKYTSPPVDGSLTVSELYDFHYANNPHHPVFRYPDSTGNMKELRYSEVVPAAYEAARFVAKLANIDLSKPTDGSPRPLVAIVATTDTITYFTTLVGVLRAEIPIFPISPRNSPAAIAGLISVTRPTVLLISVEESIQELVRASLLETEEKPLVHQMPRYEELYLENPTFTPLPPRRRDLDAIMLLMHTSGSSSLPKPIFWNDRGYLEVAMAPLFGARDLCEAVFASHGVTMFHAIGLNTIPWLAVTGLVMATFPPVSPAIIATPDSVYNGAVESRSDYIFGVPSFVKEWSQDPAKVAHFQSMDGGLCFGGAPLDKTLGDSLAEKGIALYSMFGASDVGVFMLKLPENPGMDWEYITLNPHCAAEFIPIGDGTYELVIVARETQVILSPNSKYRGADAFATSDVVVPHPTKPGRWKVIGRKDHTIVLSTGEKTNPGPLEEILCHHPQVAHALIFGRSRFQIGALIHPTPDASFDPTNEAQLVEFRNSLWPYVEEMNQVAPSHSRLFKEMILVTHPSKSFPLTPKGAPRITLILSDYATEIDNLYNAVEEASVGEGPEEWTPEATLNFVRSTVGSVMKSQVSDKDDIFASGCDSLQATWIRNSITRALRLTRAADASKISPNCIYDYPTISSLASFIDSLSSSTAPVDRRTTPEELQAFLSRYTHTFPTHSSSADQPHTPGDVVLVTGTTGSLGSAVLSKLASLDTVTRVYALNRSSNAGLDIFQRQEEALKDRGYDPRIARSDKVVLLEGNLTGTGLGVSDAIENEIRRTVTHIIHIAWRVDFNLSLQSFEANVGGVRTLVDLALSSPQPNPPRIIFTSSIGVSEVPVRIDNVHSPVPETAIDNPSVPLGQGYAESKWVAETLLNTAAHKTVLRPVVIRLGQISGGVNGAWNITDWFPSLVKSSATLGFLPTFGGVCSWVPLDLAADIIVDIRNSSASTLHLVHPTPVPAQNLLQAIGRALSIPLRSFKEWVQSLEEAADSISSQTVSQRGVEKLPAIKLLEFFKGAAKNEEDLVDDNAKVESLGLPTLEVSQAKRESTHMANISRGLGDEDVRKWIEYWRAIGYL
ncbi:acetyl-CoA synthetase-like protein [Infundibulicybe gibba]|nr:acetyl-CoA synthetase-like protein [Infundibulicybe gibba]